jgi:DNA-binding CsgD family transcriptional regulator
MEPERPVESFLDQGREALALADWEAARRAFERSVEQDPSPEALEGLAHALWWLADSPGAIDRWEQAYTGYRAAGDDERAARVALLLSEEHAEARGNEAAANGWLARARDLLSGVPASPAQGWLRLREAVTAVDPEEGLSCAGEALEAGRRLRDPDLELSALGRVGLAEIELGRFEEGATLLEEALAVSTSGEPHDLRTLGDVYCTTMLAVELTLDMRRFGQWNELLLSFFQRYNHPAVLTFCGTCCAEVLNAAGKWEEGERWLVDTLHKLQSTGQQARCVHPATKLASLRIQQGRLEEAERLLEGYEDLPEAVQPMVWLYMARGQTALAAARLLRRLNEVGRDNLLGAPLLAMLVDVQLAQGDREGAAATAGFLAEVGARTGRDRVQADAELALGSAAAAGEEPQAAEHLERAIDLFAGVRMPLGGARAHLALARVLSQTEPERAVEEARQALATFERLGATRDADAAAGFLRELGVGGRTGPKLLAGLSKREVEVLRLLGEGLTNAEIAARLYISTKTVATHVGNIFAKLLLRNRAEAAAYAQRYLTQDVK